MDSREFRNALGQFTTGVCLVSVVDAHHGPLAMTVNSFSSVSLEPPLVLWSIQNTATYFNAFTECEQFGVSILHARQADLSSHYARREGHPITGEDFAVDDSGVPLLQSAIAQFTCRRWALYPGGDHHIIVGEVTRFDWCDGSPLVFSGGQYKILSK